jgi:hypothetical protein
LHVSSSGDEALLSVDGATNGTVLFVTGSGQVGIGTASPSSSFALDIPVSASTVRMGRLELGAWPNSTEYGFIGHSYQDHHTGNKHLNYNVLIGTSGDLSLSSRASTDMYFRIGAVVKAVLDSNGNFGVGTTTPTAQLAVNGALHVTGSILPGADNSHDLGSSAMRWANLYTGDLHLANDRGDWTVIEEENYLTIRSNKTGKRFKLLMEEIED